MTTAVLEVALPYNTTLTTLDLNRKLIGDKGATALGVALHHNTTLTTLFLRHNNIGDEGATALGVALHHNTTLTTLLLFQNSIGNKVARALDVALQRNEDIFSKKKKKKNSKMFWTPCLHQHFPLSCRNIVLTTLLNNGPTSTCSALPEHVWWYIFSFWQRGIFHE